MLDVTVYAHGVTKVRMDHSLIWLGFQDNDGREITLFAPLELYRDDMAALGLWWRRLGVAILAAADLPGELVQIDQMVQEPAAAHAVGVLLERAFAAKA